MPSVAHHQPFASERHPSNSGKSTILIYYFVPLVSRNYWSYTGWSKYSYQYLCFPVSGFLEVRHLEDLSLSLYVYIIIYIYRHVPRSYQHVSEDTPTHVFHHILCIYTDDDSRVFGGVSSDQMWPSPFPTTLCLLRGTRPPLSVVPLFGTRGIRSFVVPCTMLLHPGLKPQQDSLMILMVLQGWLFETLVTSSKMDRVWEL